MGVRSALLLTWEYPPRIISPISHYCYDLATGLNKKGLEVIVITFYEGRTTFWMERDGLYVFCARNPIRRNLSPLTWSLTLASEIERVASDILHRARGNIDLIHANDWITFPAAAGLKNAFGKPLVITFHSIEPTRVPGIEDDYTGSIKKMEWQASYEASRILVNNLWMKYKLVEHYQVPTKKIDVVVPHTKFWLKDVLNSYEKAISKARIGVRDESFSP
jgi:1,4-alpha-glucan branching enzyme